MKIPRGRAEKFSAAGQLCKISEGNESNFLDVARMERRAIRDGLKRGTSGPGLRGACHRARIRATRWLHPGYGDDVERYRFALTCSAELCAASASLAEIAAVSAAVPQLGESLPLPQARGR